MPVKLSLFSFGEKRYYKVVWFFWLCFVLFMVVIFVVVGVLCFAVIPKKLCPAVKSHW